MLYGDEKTREMARSILPSSSAKGARDDKRHVNRLTRHNRKQACRKALQFVHGDLNLEGAEDITEETDFGEGRRRRDIRWVVDRRQGADKLAHFERWAIKVTGDMGDDPGGRLARMRSILPDDLIGGHAISHLRFLDEFKTQRESRWNYKTYADRRNGIRFVRGVVIELLHKIVEDSEALAALNEFIARRHCTIVWKLGFWEKPLIDKECYAFEGKAGQRLDKQLIPATKEVGPDKAPRLHPGNVSGFYDKLVAACRRDWIPIPNGEADGLFFSEEYVADPTCHPEWLASLFIFLRKWRKGGRPEEIISEFYGSSWDPYRFYFQRKWWEVRR